MTLNELKIGESAIIREVGGQGSLRQHFLDMGVIPGALVTLIKYAPMGDPVELLIHGYKLTLRISDAEQLVVEPADAKSLPESVSLRTKKMPHPGFGEGGRFHPAGSGNPLPEGTKLTFALVGNQNCGKTTLFNQLTGSNQHVFKFPVVSFEVIVVCE